MVELPDEVEQTLRDLPDAEWTALQARIRPPDTAEAFRTAAAQHVSDDQLDSLMAIVDPSKFVGADGQIDADKVGEHLGRWFGPGESQVTQSPRQWGQYSGAGGPAVRPGDHGKAEAARRAGRELDHENLAATTSVTRGGAGKAEAARRFGAHEGSRK